MAQQAQETFVVELADGPLRVERGAVFGDTHPAVKLDGGRGLLFKPLDVDDKPPAPAPKAGRAAAKST